MRSARQNNMTYKQDFRVYYFNILYFSYTYFLLVDPTLFYLKLNLFICGTFHCYQEIWRQRFPDSEGSGVQEANHNNEL